MISMIARTKSAAANPVAPSRTAREVWPMPPQSLEDRLHRIEAMGQRITGYIQFMCQVASLNGSSAEAKERGVAAFYEQMLVVENQLRKIQESLWLE
jgi:hypothetical protein